jgi:hypothetical protein
MTSPDVVTWTAQSAPESSGWQTVTFGNGLFVAVDSYSTGGMWGSPVTKRVMTSSDGINLTARSAAEANSWRSVTYGNGRFVAVANSGTNRVMTSPDGITWTAQSAAAENGWLSVTYGNGTFVAVSSAGTNRVMTSSDGITWTARSAAAETSWRAVTFGNGLFVAVSTGLYPPPDAISRVMTSTDGVTWTAQSATEENSWWTVTYGNGLFVALANDGGANRVMTSPDGATWSPMAAAADINWRSVAFGNNTFVGLSSDGDDRVMTWEQVSAPSAPTSLNATPGNGSVSIAFTPGADGGAAITKYQYKVGNGSWTDAVGTSSPITVSGLTNYATVNIRLRAVNSAGAGAASTFVQVWPRLAGSSLTSVIAQSSSRIVAAFSAITPVGGRASHYWVYAYEKGTNTVAGSCRSTAAARSCVVTGLSANTEYDVAVRGFFTLTGSPTVLPTTDSARQTVRTRS